MQNIDWEFTRDIHLYDANHSFKQFLKKNNEVLGKNTPLKYMSKKTRKNISKHSITKGILISIKIKNTLYKKFCCAKDNKLKPDLHNKFKTYRNLILTSQEKAKTPTLKASLKETKKWS